MTRAGFGKRQRGWSAQGPKAIVRDMRLGRIPDPKLVYDTGLLLKMLREHPRRMVYRALKGYWCLTNSLGSSIAFPEIVVRDLVSLGSIRQYYSNSDLAYGLEPTIDVEATVAARRAGDKTALVRVPA